MAKSSFQLNINNTNHYLSAGTNALSPPGPILWFWDWLFFLFVVYWNPHPFCLEKLATQCLLAGCVCRSFFFFFFIIIQAAMCSFWRLSVQIRAERQRSVCQTETEEEDKEEEEALGHGCSLCVCWRQRCALLVLLPATCHYLSTTHFTLRGRLRFIHLLHLLILPQSSSTVSPRRSVPHLPSSSSFVCERRFLQ